MLGFGQGPEEIPVHFADSFAHNMLPLQDQTKLL